MKTLFIYNKGNKTIGEKESHRYFIYIWDFCFLHSFKLKFEEKSFVCELFLGFSGLYIITDFLNCNSKMVVCEMFLRKLFVI